MPAPPTLTRHSVATSPTGRGGLRGSCLRRNDGQKQGVDPMADITPDEFRGLAKVAGLRLLDEDVEPLTVQFNALREALEVLDEHDLYGVAPLPALQYPADAPGGSPSPQPSPLKGEGAGTGPSTGSGGSTGSPRAEKGPKLTESSDHPMAYKTITELAYLLRTKAGVVGGADADVPRPRRAVRRGVALVRDGDGGVGAGAGGEGGRDAGARRGGRARWPASRSRTRTSSTRRTS